MRLGKVRTIVQQRIDEEYIILKGLIGESSDLFKTHLLKISELEEKEIVSINENDLEVKWSIEQSISTQYGCATEYYESILSASRRIYLVAIFSYYEGCLNDIVRANNIIIPNRANTGTLIEKIEKSKGSIPSALTTYKDLVTEELRVLRNFCTHHNKETEKKALDIIKEKDGLKIQNGQLVITEYSILMCYLDAVKMLLELLDKHCSKRHPSSRPPQ